MSRATLISNQRLALIIEARARSRQEEARALTRFRTLFEGASIGIVRMSREGSIVEVNPALEQMLETEARLLVSRGFSEHLVTEHRTMVDGLLREMMTGHRAERR